MKRIIEHMQSTEYKTIDIRTLEGLKRAEWYEAHGWIIGSVGLNTIQFYKKIRNIKKCEEVL